MKGNRFTKRLNKESKKDSETKTSKGAVFNKACFKWFTGTNSPAAWMEIRQKKDFFL